MRRSETIAWRSPLFLYLLISIVPDIRLPQHLLPARRLAADERGKLLRRAGDGEIAGLVEFLPHVGLRQNVHHFAVELVDDRGRLGLGGDQAEPYGDLFEVLQSRRRGERRHGRVGLGAAGERGLVSGVRRWRRKLAR